MEMSSVSKISLLTRVGLCLLVMLFISFDGMAQPVKKYTVKDGRMFITLGKDLPEQELKDFIKQFDLENLSLDKFLKEGFSDSLTKAGWHVESMTKGLVVVSKPLLSFQEFNDPSNRILFAGKQISFNALFPSVSNSIRFGYNRFRNKSSFRIIDSVVQFFLRGHANAGKVYLAGSFNDWNPKTLPMTKTDSGWVCSVKLRPGKYWYKFIADENWMTDNDNRINENDGLGNTNSVFYYTNTIFRLAGYQNAKRVILTGSFNNWNESDLQLEKKNGGWELPVYLANGTHTYRFIVDKNWMIDPANPLKFPNEFGEHNSVITLGKPHHFELKGFANAKNVVLTGSFNGWRKDELFMVRNDAGWTLPYVLGPGNYQYRFIVDGKEIVDPSNPPAMIDQNANSILILEPNYTFRLSAYPQAKKVVLAGDFNEWSSDAFLMKREGNEWVLTVHLSPGKHLYKFVVDGNWILDPGNEIWEQNEHHTGNSVIWLDK